MGHLINPISTRLAFTSFWLSAWTNFSLRNFSYGLMLDYGLASLIEWAFIYSWFAQVLTKNGVFLSHYRLIRRGRLVRIHAFLIYNSSRVLKSSFVEVAIDPSPLDWTSLWARRHQNARLRTSLLNQLVASIRTVRESKFISLKNKNEAVAVGMRLLSATKGLGAAGANKFTTNRSSNIARLPLRLRTEGFEALILKYKSHLRNFRLAKALELAGNHFAFLFSSLFSQFLSKIASFRNSFLSIGFRFISNFNLLNPQFLARFIARRVSYGFQLTRVIRPIMKDLIKAMGSRRNKIIGFRIACSGRFDRKQIAAYTWHKAGPVPLNQFTANVSYGFATAFLKYGACGIKVWIISRHNVLKSQHAARSDRSAPEHLGLLLNSSKIVKRSDSWNKLIYAFQLFDSFDVASSNALNYSFLSQPVCFLPEEWEGCEEKREVLAKRLQLLSAQWLRNENVALAVRSNFNS